MLRRLLLIGRPADERRRLAGSLDTSLDVELRECEDAQDALRLLPAERFDLLAVLSSGRPTPGSDLVAALHRHALHGDTPVLFVGGEEPERRRARAAGASRLIGLGSSPELLRETVGELLEIG